MLQINNLFDFIITFVFIVLGLTITPYIIYDSFKKGREALKKYGWGKVPKNFAPDYGNSTIEILLGGIVGIVFYIGALYFIIKDIIPALFGYISGK